MVMTPVQQQSTYAFGLVNEALYDHLDKIAAAQGQAQALDTLDQAIQSDPVSVIAGLVNQVAGLQNQLEEIATAISTLANNQNILTKHDGINKAEVAKLSSAVSDIVNNTLPNIIQLANNSSSLQPGSTEHNGVSAVSEITPEEANALQSAKAGSTAVGATVQGSNVTPDPTKKDTAEPEGNKLPVAADILASLANVTHSLNTLMQKSKKPAAK